MLAWAIAIIGLADVHIGIDLIYIQYNILTIMIDFIIMQF